jgi:hypothetical protein
MTTLINGMRRKCNAFFPANAAAILSMPRPRSFQEDFWAWGWDNSGVFSVRSVYRELVRRNTISNDGTGSSTDDSNTWKHLWKLKVMPKIRIFSWRVIKNLLPTAGELHRRHIKEVGNCPLCGHDNETLFHALTECEHAKVFWVAAQDFFEVKLPKLNPATWARDILDPSLIKKYDAAIVVSVMWAIWGSRNKYNHGEEKYQPLKSMELVYEFVKSLDIPMTESVIVDSIIPRWKRPPAGWLKINTDGAISALESLAGVGIVVRDEAGDEAGEVVMVEGHKY